jgi:hypothetical protein
MGQSTCIWQIVQCRWSPALNENPELMVIVVAGNNPMRGFISIKYLNLMIQIHVAEVLLT